MKRILLSLVAFLFVLPQFSFAAEQTPSSVVAAFHNAVKAGDKNGAVKLLLPELVVFEDSYMEPYAPYVSGHLNDDITFNSKVKTTIVFQTETLMGDAAMVLTQTEINGRYMGRDLHLRAVETMVLRKGDAGWKIAHIHSSNRESN